MSAMSLSAIPDARTAGAVHDHIIEIHGLLEQLGAVAACPPPQHPGVALARLLRGVQHNVDLIEARLLGIPAPE